MLTLILALLALVAIYGNVQRWRRDKLEHVMITPAAAPTATPTPAAP